MADDPDFDCDCVYGDEFVDDGIPHRFITKMCARCTAASEKLVAFFADTRARGCGVTIDGPAGAIPCTEPPGHTSPHVTAGGWKWRSPT